MHVRFVAAVVAGVLVIAGTARADWGPKRDPFDRGVVARYEAILARDPHDPALAQLAAMYKRFRTLEVLIAEYDAKLGPGDGDGAVLIVIGRLLEESKQPASALSAYHRAWSVRSRDPKLALRIAAIERTANQPEAARVAYERALTGDKPIQREALRGLLDLARARRDRVSQASLSKQLAELDPRDPRLQVDLGDAMLAIDLIDPALESYAAAERLYATDPVRRLEVISRRGQALERRDRGAAETEYRRALAQVPKDHYLRTELYGRIVELHRSAGTLGALLAISLEDWPVASRGVFEWHELAKLYEAVGDAARSLAAFEQAVKRSPEARLHLELADRLIKTREVDALEILTRLVARSPRDITVLSSVAERYAKWGKLGRAVDAYDKVLRLDPAAADRMIDLVEENFRADKHAAAVSLARSVAFKLRTGESHGRLGNVLLEWGRDQEAVKSYAAAITLEPKVADHWRGRAAARDQLGQLEAAVVDGTKVIELAGTDPKARRIARKELVRIVLHSSGETGARARFVDAWRDAFDAEPPDVEAGFLLLDYFGISPCEHWHAMKRPCDGEVVRIVRRLSRFATLDPDDIISVATAYSAARRHDEAIEILGVLRELTPSRTVDITERIAKITKQHHIGISYGLANGEELVDPDREIRRHRRIRRVVDDAIDAPFRLALRIGYGNGLRGGGEDFLSGGVMAAGQLGRNVFLTARVDWSQRDGAAPFTSVGGSVGIGKSILTTRNTTLVLGFAERVERRWGHAMESAGYGLMGLSADATLDLVGRRMPASIGARLEQGMSDDARSTALMLELAFEIR